ncbi:hypothetical protein F4679DRAFT_584279 [Xylaria curta]|nr:hypothetical protein F4679DRAFT_584279 [Xylaria curta]
MAKRVSRLKAKRIVRGTSTTVVAQKRNLILGLPAEIRIMIYTFAVVSQWDFESLQTPELSQVSRQLRDEVLPIYYRKNSFLLFLSPPDGWYDMRSPANCEETAKYYYESFKPLCKSLVPFICHITALRVNLVDTDGLHLGFMFRPATHNTPDSSWDSSTKIGHGYTDWSDRNSVMKAFRAAMRNDFRGFRNHQAAKKYFNIFLIASALRFFKKHCAAAHDTRLICEE